ncbi:MAG TPA: sulfatase-like hydrolase/transferase [Pyrinomonadaceae bacterium]|nr:sulfatase-like hydrolase/transferase [Pyrinomonadaceae bacterium]
MKPDRARPNFLIFMVDEVRYPPVYETDEIKEWRRTYLKAQDMLRQTGIEFKRHYIASAACCPSRSSLFTGQYPSLHGVTQTPGAAKNNSDPGMFWLDPNTVPTMGDYFRAAGYRTFYKGKWHISDGDIILPGTRDPLMTWGVSTDNGSTPVPIPRNIEIYRMADRLDDYGFSGWIGPEPHGSEQANTGMNRDQGFAQEAIALLDELEAESEARDGQQSPWLIVNSYVNPHDIAMFNINWPNWGYPLTDDTVPDIPPSPTHDEDLDTKPSCQESYINVYPHMIMPQPPIEIFRKFYYYLQKTSDELIQKVYARLRGSSFFENTIVIFTSDHGDMLGAHGGQHQKWHNAYEETIHVPLIISSPAHFKEPRSVDTLTSHVDLIPTLLALAGADQKEVQEAASRDHCEVRPLVGRDLSALILNHSAPPPPGEPVYFMTDDEISEGLSQFNLATGRPYTSVIQPNHVETVVALFSTESGDEVWKYSRYFDNPDFWTSPGQYDIVSVGKEQQQRTEPAPDEYEMYNLTLDPLETINLVHSSHQTPETQKRHQELKALLAEQNARKRLTPRNETDSHSSTSGEKPNV